MECAPGSGGLVASSGEICANTWASEGAYQASLRVAAQYASAIRWVWFMGVWRRRGRWRRLRRVSLHQAERSTAGVGTLGLIDVCEAARLRVGLQASAKISDDERTAGTTGSGCADCGGGAGGAAVGPRHSPYTL